MNTKYFWRIILLIILVIPFIVACGDDSTDLKVIDGVRVASGRKLTKIMVVNGNKKPYQWIINHDSHNRISEIISRRDTITIDYSRKIFFYKKYGSSLLPKEFYSFITNERGLIAKIDNLIFSYDEAGRLINIKGAPSHSIFYVNDELASYQRIEELVTTLYDISNYQDYGEGDFNIGVSISGTGKYSNRLTFDDSVGFVVTILQSGMLGNPPQLFQKMSQQKESIVYIMSEYEVRPGKKDKDEIKCTFVYE